jgi:hypothetical protein
MGLTMDTLLDHAIQEEKALEKLTAAEEKEN